MAGLTRTRYRPDLTRRGSAAQWAWVLVIAGCFSEVPTGPADPEPLVASTFEDWLLGEVGEVIEAPAPFDREAFDAMSSEEKVAYVISLQQWSEWRFVHIMVVMMDLMGSSVPCRRADEAIVAHLDAKRPEYARTLIQWVEASAALDDDERARALETRPDNAMSQAVSRAVRRVIRDLERRALEFTRRCRNQMDLSGRRMWNFVEDRREGERLARTGRRVGTPSQ